MASPDVPVRSVVRSANELQRARKKKISWSIDEIQQELEWRSWFPDVPVDWTADVIDDDIVGVYHAAFLKFCEDNLSIKFPGLGRIPLRLRDAQSEVAWDWLKYRRNICLKARQIGFSTLVAAYTLWQVWGWRDRHVVMLSRTERESVALLNKARYAYRSMPEWVRLRGPKLLDKTRLQMSFDNDSILQSMPSNNDPARGESLFQVILDEWAFLPNPEQAWASVEPTTDLGGRVIGLSTANGEGTFFHEMWLQSQAGTNGFRSVFFPWSAVDSRGDEWYETKKRELAGRIWQLHQEYPNDPVEAFIGSGNPVFSMDLLSKFKSVDGVQYTISGDNPKSVVLYDGGPFTIFEAPNDKDRWTYVIGADIAEGLEHGDATVAQVICLNTGQLVATWHGRIDPDVFGLNVLPAIGWFYRNALIVPEVNNHGLTVLKALQRAKYKYIYKRRTFTKRVDRAMESMGWLTTHTSKPLMIDELGGWLRDQENIPDQKTLHELRTFKREPNGRMNGSPHDDCVMSLAMAVQGLKYGREEKFGANAPATSVKGSFAWWEKRLADGKRNSGGVSPIV